MEQRIADLKKEHIFLEERLKRNIIYVYFIEQSLLKRCEIRMLLVNY